MTDAGKSVLCGETHTWPDLPRYGIARCELSRDHEGRHRGHFSNEPLHWVNWGGQERDAQTSGRDSVISSQTENGTPVARTARADTSPATPTCRECGGVVEVVGYMPFPQPSAIKNYAVTMPCGHSAGFNGDWPKSREL